MVSGAQCAFYACCLARGRLCSIVQPAQLGQWAVGSHLVSPSTLSTGQVAVAGTNTSIDCLKEMVLGANVQNAQHTPWES